MTGRHPIPVADPPNARESRGFDVTQEKFAQRLGISQSQLSKYERGLIPPAADVLLKLNQKLGVSVDWAIDGQRQQKERLGCLVFLPLLDCPGVCRRRWKRRGEFSRLKVLQL